MWIDCCLKNGWDGSHVGDSFFLKAELVPLEYIDIFILCVSI